MFKPLVTLLTGSKPKISEPFLEVYATTSDLDEETCPVLQINFTSPNATEKLLAFTKSHSKEDPFRVTFVTHGYMSHIKKEGEYFYDIKDAILRRGRDKSNLVILVDWSSYSGNTVFDYGFAIHNVLKVSGWVGEFVKVLRTEFGDKVYIHGIGFSLGAHLMGNAAEGLLETESDGRKWFDRITGLDPAGPGVVFKEGIFSLMHHQTGRLRSEHADFVDVIHTSDHLGTTTRLGHVDFYINWGSTQKGFPNIGYLNVPSHIFCLKLFLHTILDEDNKDKYASSSHIRDLETKQIDDIPDKAATMGYFCHREARGMYYLEVDGKKL